MKLVTYRAASGGRLGALLDDGAVLDLAEAAACEGQSCPDDMQAFIDGGEPCLTLARRLIERRPSSAIRPGAALLAPLPRPIRLRDCSLFLEHMEVALEKIARLAAERDGTVPTGPALPPVYKEQVIYYNADNVHVFGPEDEIVWPPNSDWMDYELEWACVIGKTGRDIGRETARDHIFGVTVFNDWSARDLQLPFMAANLGPGEGKDFANSLGPCIATLDELDDPYACRMTATINGEIWSEGSTASMHHRFEDAIVQFSRGKTLFAGEVLGSGTVLSGCGFELDRRLSDGDVVTLEVAGIGELRNRVVRAGKLHQGAE